jgi:hypothetical protein
LVGLQGPNCPEVEFGARFSLDDIVELTSADPELWLLEAPDAAESEELWVDDVPFELPISLTKKPALAPAITSTATRRATTEPLNAT